MGAPADGPRQQDGGDAGAMSLEGVALAPLDRVFPTRPVPFLVLVVLVAAATWGAGLVLAPDPQRFLASSEWRFMPLYLAAHLVAVRLFVSTFTRSFWAGVQHLDVAPETAMRGVRWLLGIPGALAALVVASPFAWFDYLYMTGANSRYERMGPEGSPSTIDYIMWGTWAVEWFLNALIWVMLLGFLAKNCAMIANRSFKAPIELVVAERHYRPFLQMSAEGASIVLGFSAVTIFYLWYTGGEITDYVGLAITSSLLVVGFVPPWVMLRRKVRRAVEIETRTLRTAISAAMWRDARARRAAAEVGAGGRAVPASSPTESKASLEQRLEEALSLFRISYLEHLKLNLGGSEARAILLRLVAPAVGVAWQLTQNHQTLMPKIEGALKSATTWFGRLGLW